MRVLLLRYINWNLYEYTDMDMSGNYDNYLYVNPVLTECRILLPQSDVDKLEGKLTASSHRLHGTRAVATCRVAVWKVRSNEVGTVVISVRGRCTTHVNHL